MISNPFPVLTHPLFEAPLSFNTTTSDRPAFSALRGTQRGRRFPRSLLWGCLVSIFDSTKSCQSRCERRWCERSTGSTQQALACGETSSFTLSIPNVRSTSVCRSNMLTILLGPAPSVQVRWSEETRASKAAMEARRKLSSSLSMRMTARLCSSPLTDSTLLISRLENRHS